MDLSTPITLANAWDARSPDTSSVSTAYASQFAPASVTPGASSFIDVLKFGISRYADYQTGKLALQSTQPSLATPTQSISVPTGTAADSRQGGGISLDMLLLIGVGIYVALR